MIKYISKAPSYTQIAVPDFDEHFEKILKKQEWRPYQYRQLIHGMHFCNDFDVALDIGANIGLTVQTLTQYFKRVYAFEPSSINFDCLIENAPSAYNYKFALSNKTEEGYLKHTLNCGGFHLTEDKDEEQLEIVEKTRLDDLHFIALINDRRINFIKIDVQGHEKQVLEGAVGTIRKHKPVIMVEYLESDILKKFGMRQVYAYKKETYWKF